MRGKKAKAIRRSMSINVNETIYDKAIYKRTYLDFNGIVKPYEVYTQYLIEGCGRRIYQRAKRAMK